MTDKTDITLVLPSAISPDWKNWSNYLATALKLTISQLGLGNPNITLRSINEKSNIKNVAEILIIPGEISQSELAEIDANLNKTEQSDFFVIFTEYGNTLLLPLKLRFSPSYTFFDIDSETGLTRVYKPFGSFDEQRLYWAKVLDLAFDIGNKISIRDIEISNNRAIYLAQTNPEQFESRDAIRSELIHRGFSVYPSHLLDGSADQLSTQISEYLEKCSMSVHIIGNTYGPIVKGTDNSLVELQCRLAAKRWRLASQKNTENTFQRIVWLPPGIKPEDERHRLFVSSLRIEEKDASSEIVQTPIEDLKTVLREKINSIINASSDKELTNPQHCVYLIHEQKDTTQLTELSQSLKSKGFDVLNIDFSKTTEHVVSVHYQYLTKADSIIICDFNSQKQWINSKLKDLVKAPGYGRKAPFQAQAIYTKQVSRYANLGEGNTNLVLDANINPSNAIEPFLQKINQK